MEHLPKKNRLMKNGLNGRFNSHQYIYWLVGVDLFVHLLGYIADHWRMVVKNASASEITSHWSCNAKVT